MNIIITKNYRKGLKLERVSECVYMVERKREKDRERDRNERD